MNLYTLIGILILVATASIVAVRVMRSRREPAYKFPRPHVDEHAPIERSRKMRAALIVMAALGCTIPALTIVGIIQAIIQA